MGKQATPDVEVTGDHRLVYPSKYLKAVDLRGKDVTIVIDHVTMTDLVMAGGKTDRKAVIHMRSVAGKLLEKTWPVGNTVLGQIAEALDRKVVREWKGGRVTMYPTTCRGKKGETVDCIRVRLRENPRASEPTDEMAAPPRPEFVEEAEAGVDGAGGGT